MCIFEIAPKDFYFGNQSEQWDGRCQMSMSMSMSMLGIDGFFHHLSSSKLRGVRVVALLWFLISKISGGLYIKGIYCRGLINPNPKTDIKDTPFVTKTEDVMIDDDTIYTPTMLQKILFCNTC
jgi:hypothetical protein